MIIKKQNFLIKILHSQKFFALISLSIIILISLPLIKKVNKRSEINNKIQNLEKEINEFESANKNLTNLIAYLESNQFVEEHGRLNLGLKKPGESVVVMENKNNTNLNADSLNSAENNKKLSNQQKWWNYFLKK